MQHAAVMGLAEVSLPNWLQVMGASEVSEGGDQGEEDDEETEANFMEGMFAE